MAFDATRFLNTVYEDAFDDKRPLFPEGDFKCYIKGVDVAPGNRPDALQLRVSLIFDDEELKKKEGFAERTEIVKNEIIFVDVDPETQMIKYGGGMNWQLGAVRSAAGQNNPGQPWNPGQLQGAGPMWVRIQHSEIKRDIGGGRKEPTGEMRDNIAKWAAA